MQHEESDLWDPGDDAKLLLRGMGTMWYGDGGEDEGGGGKRRRRRSSSASMINVGIASMQDRLSDVAR
jgi:hypothetical protein